MENSKGFTADKVSIIIPCRKVNTQTLRCINFCMQLPNNPQILVIPDSLCAGLPATKRNFAMDIAKGEVFAFIDSDAYPAIDWLENALPHLDRFAAVCGPGILPYDASLKEQATDLVYRLLPYSYRVTPKRQRIVPEFPSFNLIVRKDKAPKFKSLLTGEDSLFCRELKGFILYDPTVIVYHSRRPLFKPFWRQVATYGKHRGYLVKLAFLGWVSGVIVYIINFLKGFFKKRIK